MCLVRWSSGPWRFLRNLDFWNIFLTHTNNNDNGVDDNDNDDNDENINDNNENDDNDNDVDDNDKDDKEDIE